MSCVVPRRQLISGSVPFGSVILRPLVPHLVPPFFDDRPASDAHLPPVVTTRPCGRVCPGRAGAIGVRFVLVGPALILNVGRGVSRCLNAAPAGELSRRLGFRPRSNHSQTIQAFGCAPLTNRKSFCRTFAATTGEREFSDEEGSRLGERAPIPRDSFVVPSNRGPPSPSKLVSPGAGRGMGTSRSGGARSLLRGLRQPRLRPTRGSTGENWGVWRARLRLVGQGVSLVLLRATRW